MQIVPRDIILSALMMAVLQLLLGRKEKQKDSCFYALCAVVFAALMATIFSLTGISPLSGFHLDFWNSEINLVPYGGLRHILGVKSAGYRIANVLGNILMFVPVGFFPPLLYKGLRKNIPVVLFGAGVSCGIEITQLFLSRSTDIDDLLLNTLGAVLGLVCCRIAEKLLPRVCHRLKECARAQSKVTLVCGIFIPYLMVIVCGAYDRLVYFST